MSDEFRLRNDTLTARMAADPAVARATREWFEAVVPYEYHYHFTWMGVPIIQFPSDIVVMQELLWEVRPDLVIETGIARGGSLVFYASMLELIGGGGTVLGVDRDIRPHTEEAVRSHPTGRRIRMIQGGSTSREVVQQVTAAAAGAGRVLVVLDSNHTHAHVLEELTVYAPLVSRGSYLVVFDTVIEDMPDHMHTGKPWCQGDSPRTAVREFLASHSDFTVDPRFEHKALVTVGPGGFLKRS
jgi:cephalosporin hydroxylase